jgi:hypothetical protein
MKQMYVVVSVWHGGGRDRTFLHGVFDDVIDAEIVANDVASNHEYVMEEGYSLDKTNAHSIYIAVVPSNRRINDYVPTVI